MLGPGDEGRGARAGAGGPGPAISNSALMEQVGSPLLIGGSVS